MQDGSSHTDLARLLANDFRMTLLDRRGRGGSATSPIAPGTEREVEDLLAVLDATGATRVLGVSSGAVIAGRAALASADIDHLALFEPPLAIGDSMRLDLAPRLHAALQRGDLPAAMGFAMKVAEMGPPWMFGLPVPVLAVLSRPLLRDPATRALARALAADFAVVEENHDRSADFAAITVPTLVLTGTMTRPYLRDAALRLAATIPDSTLVQLAGQTHAATQNRSDRGHPELVAVPVAEFFR